MKTLAIASLVLFLSACSSSADQNASAVQSAPEQTADTAAAVETTQNGTDVNSGATNVANASMLNGTLMVPAESNITITLPMGGIVASFSHLPGTFVRQGEVIAVLENTEFIDLQQGYLEAAAQCDFLENEYNRQKALSAEDATSQKRLQQSRADYFSMKSRREASAARLTMLGIKPEKLAGDGIASRLEVRAPQGGYVSEVMVNQGKFVAAGEAICQIINKNQIFLNLIAYEKDLKAIRNGQKLEFRVNGLGDETFNAVVTAIDQRVDPVNRSVKVYAKATQTHPEFRPGMYVTVRIK